MKQTRPQLLGPWRRTFQWTLFAALLLVPFVRWDGKSLLRLDLPTLTLHCFGAALRIEELYLFLLLCLALTLLFLLATLMLGRVWCGWACPQTALVDLAEGFARLLGVRVNAGRMRAAFWQRALLHLFYLGVSLLCGVMLAWHFVSPYDFCPRLFAGELSTGLLVTLGSIAAVVYLDLALVRRLLCREFCPYGRFQSALIDPGTLTLRFHPDGAHRCIRCDACVRACPTGIDIRRGYQIECINCGRCLDACREVMARRGEAGIIRCTFGLTGKGPRALLTPRTALVALLFLAATAALVSAAGNRPEASLQLARSAPPRLLADGTVVTFFSGWTANRLASHQSLFLSATLEDGTPVPLKGPVAAIPLSGGEKQRLSFALVTPAPRKEKPLTVFLALSNAGGKQLARERAYVTLPKD